MAIHVPGLNKLYWYITAFARGVTQINLLVQKQSCCSAGTSPALKTPGMSRTQGQKCPAVSHQLLPPSKLPAAKETQWREEKRGKHSPKAFHNVPPWTRVTSLLPTSQGTTVPKAVPGPARSTPCQTSHHPQLPGKVFPAFTHP